MVALWCVIGLVMAAGLVSVLGAGFSVVGLAALFSGAAVAVCAMAGSLEFAKFVLAAYLHQRWKHLNFLFKGYLLGAIVVLSLITSMGIFGFLSNAYQSASAQLEAENIKAQGLRSQKAHNADEIARLNKAIDEIPANRISKRMKARAEAEPLIAELTKKSAALDELLSQSDLRSLEIKQKVGPLIYIARAFKIEIDEVVKYLILLFVCVFDPLAICLVIASSEALESRRQKREEEHRTAMMQPMPSPPPPPPPGDHGPQTAEELIQMRFADPADPSDQEAG